MSLQKLMANSAAYNSWANETLISYLKTKPAHTWHAEVPSSFNSLAKTLTHMLQVQQYWHAIITQTDSKRNGQAIDKDHPDSEAVAAALMEDSAQLRDAVAGFSDAELQKPILVKSPWFTAELPRYEYIQHLMNHSTYYRGQLVTIGRHLGFSDAPMTDYNYYNIMVNSGGQR